MSTYIRVDVAKINRYTWRAYLPSSGEFVHAATLAELKDEARRHIEETTGLKDFEVTWIEV